MLFVTAKQIFAPNQVTLTNLLVQRLDGVSAPIPAEIITLIQAIETLQMLHRIAITPPSVKDFARILKV